MSDFGFQVSTHSRLKAADAYAYVRGVLPQGFNTQPPEGGCKTLPRACCKNTSFNTQPPEGGCAADFLCEVENSLFQHTAA